MIKTSKFGGSSLANAERFRNVAKIIESDRTRRYIVVSAPGARFEGDDKITDLLFEAANDSRILEKIEERFSEIVAGLGIKIDIGAEMRLIENNIKNDRELDYIVSRGEYLTAKILAKLIGFEFVDSAEIIKLSGDNLLKERTRSLARERLHGANYAVVSGFYGSDDAGKIRTFSRGGSDYSGAIIADCVDADVYENWTDVDGFRATDPKIIKDAIKIERLTYDEAFCLASMGASVLHPCSVLPLKRSGITLVIKNTFNASLEGTKITESIEDRRYDLAGISVKKGCSFALFATPFMDRGANIKPILNKDIVLLTLVGYKSNDLEKRASEAIGKAAKISLMTTLGGGELVIGIDNECDLKAALTNLYNEFFLLDE